MRRLKLIGLAAIAILAVGAAVSSAVASAAMTLPEFSVKSNATGKSGEGKLGLAGAEIECKSGKNTLTSTNKKEGTFTIDFEGCTLGGEECHSLGDSAGVILVSGTTSLVLTTKESKDEHLVLFNVTEVHIECKFLETLTIVKGTVLGKITGSGTAYEIKVEAPGGKQEYTSYENDEGKAVETKLEGAIDGAKKFKAATETSKENKITFEVLTEIMN